MFDLPFRLAARLDEGERKKKSRCRKRAHMVCDLLFGQRRC
jgi:hypothetical protein